MSFTPIYNSSGIHACIKKLFSDPARSDRRVAIVAYVGTDGESYLPHPENLHVICSPSAGVTDPDTVRSMMKRGATVQFSDNLHMKVYWSKHRGCLITSANASSSALGINGLKEVGVLLPPGSIDIRRLIKYANPRNVTARELRRLDSHSREARKNRKKADVRNQHTPEYLDWYASPHRSQWKIRGCDSAGGTANAAKEKTKTEYGLREPKNRALRPAAAALGRFGVESMMGGRA